MVTEEEILTKEQLAELLHVSKRTVERWIEEGAVPFVRLPLRGNKTKSSIRFLYSHVMQWLNKSERKPLRKFSSEEKEDPE